MNKVVVNNCYGGFSISDDAVTWMREHGSAIEYGDNYATGIPRHDPILVACVEALGETVNGMVAELTVVTIEGSQYRIHEYDGMESVQEPSDLKWIKI